MANNIENNSSGANNRGNFRNQAANGNLRGNQVPRNTSAAPRTANSGRLNKNARPAVQGIRAQTTSVLSQPGNVRKRKKKNNNGCLITVLIFVFIIVAAVAIIWAVIGNYKPTLPGQDTGETNDNTTASDGQTSDTVDTDAISDDVTTEYIPSSGTIDSERREGCYTFFLAGHDNVSNNTDVMMVVMYDVPNKKISIMQLPRDTYTQIGGVSRKLNSTYQVMRNAAYNDGASDLLAEGMRGAADVVQDILGIPIDFWALVDLSGFVNIVDALGGVDMYVPCDMEYNDPDQDLYINLKEGYQHLDGDKAEQFIRFRKGFVQGDIGRMDAQKLFLTALAESLFNNISITNVSSIVGELINMVSTDLSLLDCVYFARNFLDVDASQITILTVPGKDVRANGNSGAWYYVPYREATCNAVNLLLNPFSDDLKLKNFDSKGILTNNNSESITEIYNTVGIDVESYFHSFNDLSEDGLDISVYK